MRCDRVALGSRCWRDFEAFVGLVVCFGDGVDWGGVTGFDWIAGSVGRSGWNICGVVGVGRECVVKVG